jgi:chemotaxis family two-component system response regulator Rcp1
LKPVPTLLMVDDNPADLGLAREALNRCAYRGQIHSAGDLVLLDLNLPKKDGLAVLAGMKANPELRCIPVVIFSTSQLGKDITRSYELGANCYVSKPGNLNDFFSAVKSIEEFWFGAAKLPPRGEEK